MLADPRTRPIQKGRASKKERKENDTCPHTADKCPGTTFSKEKVISADTIRPNHKERSMSTSHFTYFTRRHNMDNKEYFSNQTQYGKPSVRSNLPKGLATTRKSSLTSSSPCHHVKLTGKKIYASLH